MSEGWTKVGPSKGAERRAAQAERRKAGFGVSTSQGGGARRGGFGVRRAAAPRRAPKAPPQPAELPRLGSEGAFPALGGGAPAAPKAAGEEAATGWADAAGREGGAEPELFTAADWMADAAPSPKPKPGLIRQRSQQERERTALALAAEAEAEAEEAALADALARTESEIAATLQFGAEEAEDSEYIGLGSAEIPPSRSRQASAAETAAASEKGAAVLGMLAKEKDGGPPRGGMVPGPPDAPHNGLMYPMHTGPPPAPLSQPYYPAPVNPDIWSGYMQQQQPYPQQPQPAYSYPQADPYAGYHPASHTAALPEGGGGMLAQLGPPYGSGGALPLPSPPIQLALSLS